MKCNRKITCLESENLHAINDVVKLNTLDIPNLPTIILQILQGSKLCSVNDIANANIPGDLNSRYWFGILFVRTYTLTRFYQGFYESPTIINKALKKTSKPFGANSGKFILRYVEGFLIVAPNEEHWKQKLLQRGGRNITNSFHIQYLLYISMYSV